MKPALGTFYFIHFTGEETEAQGKGTQCHSAGNRKGEPQKKFRPSESRSGVLPVETADTLGHSSAPGCSWQGSSKHCLKSGADKKSGMRLSMMLHRTLQQVPLLSGKGPETESFYSLLSFSCSEIHKVQSDFYLLCCKQN